MSNPTGAERSRRYRAHKRGDHRHCAPDRPECKTVTPPPAVAPRVTRDADTTPEGVPARPYGLRARGKRMWDQLVADTDPIEVVVLVEEICRTADRLDRLDAIVNGRDRAWLTLEVDDVGEVTVIVDKVLGEGRQQQMAFKGLLSELRAMRGTSAKTSGHGRGPAQTPQSSSGNSQGGGANVVGIAAHIAGKLSGAAG